MILEKARHDFFNHREVLSWGCFLSLQMLYILLDEALHHPRKTTREASLFPDRNIGMPLYDYGSNRLIQGETCRSCPLSFLYHTRKLVEREPSRPPRRLEIEAAL